MPMNLAICSMVTLFDKRIRRKRSATCWSTGVMNCRGLPLLAIFYLVLGKPARFKLHADWQASKNAIRRAPTSVFGRENGLLTEFHYRDEHRVCVFCQSHEC